MYEPNIQLDKDSSPQYSPPVQPQPYVPPLPPKKAFKRRLSYLMLSLIVYTIITYAVVIAAMILQIIVIAITSESSAEYDRLVEEYIEKSDQFGTSSIFAVVIGFIVLALMMKKNSPPRVIFSKDKKMTPAVFFMLMAVFMGSQLIFTGVDALTEFLLNMGGYSAQESIEASKADSTTISMFLYAGIFGPVVEELVYRGVVMRALKPYGKVFAIVVSAILFGAMHANLTQSMFAFMIGLVLGYTAMNYSIIWSIALHIANNMIFGDLLNYIIAPLSDTGQTIVFYSIIGLFFISGVIILIMKRKKIAEFIRENRCQKGVYGWTFTNILFLLFIAANAALAVSMIEKI